jgi:hypothetical protein
MTFALVFVLLCFVSLFIMYVQLPIFDARVLTKIPNATRLDSNLVPRKTDVGAAYATGIVFGASLVCAIFLDKAFTNYDI